MDIGKFYFLSNAYLEVFNDSYLMKNSEEINGVEHIVHVSLLFKISMRCFIG